MAKALFSAIIKTGNERTIVHSPLRSLLDARASYGIYRNSSKKIDAVDFKKKLDAIKKQRELK